MAMIVYPDEGYNSFISQYDAEAYFENRLHSDEWFTNDPQTALITALRSLQELNITIDPTVAAQLQAVKDAQCEQALHELKADIDQQVNLLELPDLKVKKKELPRYSERALAILRPYITMQTITVSR